jgi:hypothetical protein
LNTKTRFNGKVETLSRDYLGEVMNQMLRYGERVRFAVGASMPPNYQVIGQGGRNMAFDGRHILMTPKPGDFTGDRVTQEYTLQQVETLASGGKLAPARQLTHLSSTPRAGTQASRTLDVLNAEKYAYYKENRATLPADIGKYSDQVTALMKDGLPAAEAFAQVAEKHCR